MVERSIPGNPRQASPEGYAHAEGVGLDLMCRSLSHQVKEYTLCALLCDLCGL
jgi:hypothetical protein